MVWTMVPLRPDQRAKSHYSLIIGRAKVWTQIAPKSDHRALTDRILLTGVFHHCF